jgi:epoxide hydrolase
MSEAIRPFSLRTEQVQLDDLQPRLERTRWPDPETARDWALFARELRDCFRRLR